MTVATHSGNTQWQHTVATHSGNTQWQHTVATHSGNTQWQHTVATHSGYTQWQHTVATHSGNTQWQHTVATHSGNTQWQHTVATHSGNTQWQHTVATHSGYTQWHHTVTTHSLCLHLGVLFLLFPTGLSTNNRFSIFILHLIVVACRQASGTLPAGTIQQWCHTTMTQDNRPQHHQHPRTPRLTTTANSVEPTRLFCFNPEPDTTE